jgi:DNA-binding transcriptional regulator YdaS (Cro superfamily)
MHPIQRAIEAVRTQAELARLLAVSPQRITNWKKRVIPEEQCAAIERVTHIPCEELRPDLEWTRDSEGRAFSRKKDQAA